MKLRDKVVFVTDADSASGHAIVERLAAEGARFVLNSASGGGSVAALLERLALAGDRCLVANADLRRSDEANALLELAGSRLGPVDVLIVNHDVLKEASVEYADESVFLEVLEGNAKTAFVCAQSVGKQMARQQSGVIVFVNSIHADKPNGFSFAYSAAKGAVHNLAREASVYLGRYGIRVNTIEMGPVEGDDERFGSDLTSLYQFYQYKIPSAKLGTYDDLANVALFLATDEAGYINGADIRLDGGFLRHYLDVKMKLPLFEEQQSGGQP